MNCDTAASTFIPFVGLAEESRMIIPSQLKRAYHRRFQASHFSKSRFARGVSRVRL